MKNAHSPGRLPALLALFAVAMLVVLFFRYSVAPSPPYWSLSGPNSHMALLAVFVERLSYLAGALLFAVAALSAGLFVLDVCRAPALPVVERAVAAFALGLGLLALATLGLGLAGFLDSGFFAFLLGVFIVLGFTRMRSMLASSRSCTSAPLSPIERFLLASSILAALVTLVFAFAPPIYFDTLEYHLAAPAQYLKAGRISFIEYNVYSNFPSNCEMLYLSSMVLVGSKYAGATLGNLLNAFASLAAAAAAFSLGRFLHSRAAGLFAAAALITSAGFFQVATGYYVEPLQVLFTILAFLFLCRFLKEASASHVVVAALFTGFAMGVKYPAALFVAAPLAVAILFAPLPAARRVKSVLLFSAVAALAVGPWLVKNLAMTGNPVYPLLYSVFSGRDWSAAQDARWAFAHTPKGGLAPEQWARHIFGLLFSTETVSLLSFAFVPLIFARRIPRRILFALAYAVLYVLLWFAATHRIDRFALPGLAIMGAVSGAGFAALAPGWPRRFASTLLVVLLALNVFYISAIYGHAVGMDLSVPLFGDYEGYLSANHSSYPAWSAINRTIPPGSRVLLVAEAETFYIDADFAATTVFDVKPFEKIVLDARSDPSAAAAAVKSAGFDYIFVNWATFRRQQETYGCTFNGLPLAGYTDAFSPALFDSMADAAKITLVFSSGPGVYPGTPAFVLYKVN